MKIHQFNTKLINFNTNRYQAVAITKITADKVKVFQHMTGALLSNEGLLPEGVWLKSATVMHEGMEGALLSLLSKLKGHGSRQRGTKPR